MGILLAVAEHQTPWLSPAAASLVALAAVGYTGASVPLWRSGRWPGFRIVLWTAGTAAVAVTLTGPLAQRAHHDFAAHTVGHVLLGMLAPLLLALAAPITLALRRLPIAQARRVTRLLAARPVGLLTHPVIASLLDIGGLWLLYRTDLYAAWTTARPSTRSYTCTCWVPATSSPRPSSVSTQRRTVRGSPLA